MPLAITPLGTLNYALSHAFRVSPAARQLVSVSSEMEVFPLCIIYKPFNSEFSAASFCNCNWFCSASGRSICMSVDGTDIPFLYCRDIWPQRSTSAIMIGSANTDRKVANKFLTLNMWERVIFFGVKLTETVVIISKHLLLAHKNNSFEHCVPWARGHGRQLPVYVIN